MPVDLPVYNEYKKLAPNDYRALSQPFIYNHSDGMLKGEHQGAHYFTIGQRKGLNVGGTALPLFIVATDIRQNIVYVGQGEEHPGLNRKALFIKTADIHWLRNDLALKIGESKKYQVRIRYRQPLQDAELIMQNEGLYILFNELQKGISPGQFAVWYSGPELIGSGVIAN